MATLEGEGPVVIVCEPQGPFGALSNFAEIPMCLDGENWPSVEHYFQAAKFIDPSYREQVKFAASPRDAKALAWNDAFAGAVVTDWDERRLAVMRRALTAKFSQSRVAREILISTWPLPIVELSSQDRFWGKDEGGSGLNCLGNLLCEVRAEHTGETAGFSLLQQPIASSGGRSDFSLAGIGIVDAVEKFEMPALAYPAFAELGISEMMAAAREESVPVAVTNATLPASSFDLRARALDRKYASYTWFQDARSAVEDWEVRLLGILCSASDVPLRASHILAVGAGSANEAAMVWCQFGRRATLVDLGFELAANCAREAPLARVIRSPAEALASIESSTVDVYCALRTYDAANLEVHSALAEAHRVLRPGGLALLTISNGYLSSNGVLIPGQIGESGQIERCRPWKLVVELLRLMRGIGFAEIHICDLRSEIGVYCYRPNEA